jgi:hypothetical protein
MDQSRWKSPVVWTTLAALFIFVVKDWVGFDIPGWDNFVMLIVAAGTAIGIINNPEKSKGL